VIRNTDPEEIPPRDICEDGDVPPCAWDNGHDGELGEPDDPLHGKRGGVPESRGHAMHDGEKEEK
jgi:hypothetical protein